ncbi:MAG: 50S ribosomal protein L21 [Candidatus Liptonbacteria bacterium]|nr:50S ribosomal protein L21 [Candidatus Liptonbacteria bacterium]
MKLAVIKTGGKQYIVAPGKKIKVEKIAGNTGDAVKFNDVLLKVSGDNIEVGSPNISGDVEGKILRQARGDKKIVFRYHSKTRYRKKKGHRQRFTEVEIIKI